MTDKKKKETRAKRGMGSLYKIGKDGKQYPPGSKTSGVFWISYTVAGEDGKKKRIRKPLLDENGERIRDIRSAEKARKKEIAKYVTAGEVEALKSIQSEIESAEKKLVRAIEESNPPLTVSDAWSTYLSSHERPDSGERTLKDYSAYWKRFTKWIGTAYPNVRFMRDITPEIAQAYASHLMECKVSASTFNKHTGFLRLIFRILEEPSRIKDNPFTRIRKKKLKTNVRRELSLAELQTILNTAEGDLKTLLYIGTFTGLRLGDCATLKWGEVDLHRGLIRRIPNKTAGRRQEPVRVGIPTALRERLESIPSSRRKGFVLPNMADSYFKDPSILTKQIQTFFDEKCDIKIHREGTGYVKKPDPDRPGKMKRVYTGKRAVVEVGFHSLRHTYVSIHAERGTPQAVLQAVVGHGNPAMTQHYTHIGEVAAVKAAGALNIGITDAEYEVVKDPIPKWAVEKLKEMNADTWEKIREELLCES